MFFFSSLRIFRIVILKCVRYKSDIGGSSGMFSVNLYVPLVKPYFYVLFVFCFILFLYALWYFIVVESWVFEYNFGSQILPLSEVLLLFWLFEGCGSLFRYLPIYICKSLRSLVEGHWGFYSLAFVHPPLCCSFPWMAGAKTKHKEAKTTTAKHTSTDTKQIPLPVFVLSLC